MKSTSGGGIPLSVASKRTKLPAGKRDPVVVVPGSLEEAISLFRKLPPPPPGRNIPFPMAKKARRCHGCHGINDHSHEGIPFGSNRCPLEHNPSCQGGIIDGKDSKGREWRGCTSGYVGPTDYFSHDSGSEDAEFEDNNFSLTGGVDTASESNDLNLASLGASYMSSVTDPHVTSTSQSNTLFTQSSFDTVSSSQPHFHTTTVSSSQVPLLTTRPGSDHIRQEPDEQELLQEMAALDKLKKERAALEEQTMRMKKQQKLSAQRLEMQRQLQAEKDRIIQLKRSTVDLTSGGAPSGQVGGARQQDQFFSTQFPEYVCWPQH